MGYCSHCGRQFESDSAGTYTDDYGFACNECRERIHFCPCCICGRQFPVEDMVEWAGDLFCKTTITTPKISKRKRGRKRKRKKERDRKSGKRRGVHREEESDATKNWIERWEEIKKQMDSRNKKENKKNRRARRRRA